MIIWTAYYVSVADGDKLHYSVEPLSAKCSEYRIDAA
jgi:hypothetical protein